MQFNVDKSQIAGSYGGGILKILFGLLAISNREPTLEYAMNIELEEVVQDVSDEALELAAGGAQGGFTQTYWVGCEENKR